MNVGIDVSLGQVAAALVLVAIAIAASRWRDAGLEEDIAIAVARSFVQLVAIGYVIDVIFEQDDAGLVIALLAVMVIFGALTARRRAAKVPDAFWPLIAALSLAATITLGLVVGLGIFDATPRYMVPVGGMVIGADPLVGGVLTIASLASLLLFYLAQTTQSATTSYEVQSLGETQQELVEDVERMELEAQRLQTLGAIQQGLGESLATDFEPAKDLKTVE